jgi:hypothetical protein
MANWQLTTTLDRFRASSDDSKRQQLVRTLLEEFRREGTVLRSNADGLLEGDALELLARHHGLPSPLLDWTESPYIAGYFAYEGKRDKDPARVWVLDRAKLPDADPIFGNDVDVIDDRMLLRFNRRALQQRSVFLRVNTMRSSLGKLLGPALYWIDLDAADRSEALADMDAMNINATTLFDDFDGVARTVVARIP